ncbi:MAG: winged helix-turn-helix transcriptional regulator [Candidatus Micrarchaeota archaeon]|nr:winged helix-turn-helix transcriptional regulator [Candidatus Micrarchaeota archaeon]
MSKAGYFEGRGAYGKIRAMSNRHRFRILELAHDERLSISALSSKLGLSYTKCADYVRVLEKEGLVSKTRAGREVLVKSLVTIKASGVYFALKES